MTTKNIPDGPYCFTPLATMMNGNEEVILCPHFRYKRKKRAGVAFCRYLEIAATQENVFVGIGRLIKECGVNVKMNEH